MHEEIPLRFDCRGASLFGILTRPRGASAAIGVVIVVGGPQYRVGSHRQFVLLARALADASFPCLRFDYRGMGDSDGEPIAFDEAHPDIEAAVATLRERMPGLSGVALVGLCDGATASAFAARGVGACALALINPWVRSDAGNAEATLRHYYTGRIASAGFWRKLASGGIDVRAALAGLWRTAARVVRLRFRHGDADEGLAARMGRSLLSHACPTLVVLSGRDQTAAEFALAANRPGALRRALERASVSRVEVAGADHTFSAARWRDELAALTIRWLRDRAGVDGATSAARGIG